jgi:hypothetical protein
MKGVQRRYLTGMASIAQHWQHVKEALLAVRRRTWIVAALVSFAGWVLFLSLFGNDFSGWLLILDAPLNFGWIFSTFAAAGLLEQAFAKPHYVIRSERTPLWKVLLDGLGALFALAVMVLIVGTAGYGIVHSLHALGWALIGVALALFFVRSYFGVRADLRARRKAREEWLAEQATSGGLPG